MVSDYTLLNDKDIEDLLPKPQKTSYSRFIIRLCLCILGVTCLTSWMFKEKQEKRNVIIMISDGFGPAGETFTRQFYHWKEKVPYNTTLPLDRIIVGQSRTLSSSSLITDSAAGATAFACALKTYNGAIGVDANKKPCGTLLESAKLHRDMKTGLVAKSRITHATPAAFSAHIGWRDWENDIALHQVGYTPLGRTVDLMFGGGLCEFLSNTTETSCRLDDRDLLKEAKEQFDWDTIQTRHEFDQLDPTQVELPLMGLFAPHHMSYAIENDPSIQPSLPEMSQKALDILKSSTKDSKNGFFLMIEGSKIDMAAHNNDIASYYYEVMEYQKTVELVMQFVKENPGTVLISVSDHETGGLTVGRQVTETYPEYEWKPEYLMHVKNSTEVLSWQWAAAIRDKRDTLDYLVSLIHEGLGIEDPTEDELNKLLAWKEKGEKLEFFATALSDLVSKRAQIGWTTMGHTAVDVNLYAYGHHAELLKGNHENTDIGDFIHITQSISQPIYSIGDFHWYMDLLDEHEIHQLLALDHISSFYPDTLFFHTSSEQIQKDVPSWGLDRIDQRKGSDDQFHFPSSAGQGVDIYLIDTGVNIDHVDFEGRASHGPTFTSDKDPKDTNGHGSFVAGVCCGKVYGVAKRANIISVKALDHEGSGKLGNILQALHWVVKRHLSIPGAKSIINLSLAAEYHLPTNRAIEQAIKLGIHFSIAAGNQGDEACHYSPASSKDALVVGALNPDDSIASYSNIGSCVNIYAPGTAITSVWHNHETDIHILSGTSMAAPHVTGVMANLLSKHDYLPSELIDKVKKTATVVVARRNSRQHHAVTGTPRNHSGWIKVLYMEPYFVSSSSSRSRRMVSFETLCYFYTVFYILYYFVYLKKK